MSNFLIKDGNVAMGHFNMINLSQQILNLIKKMFFCGTKIKYVDSLNHMDI